MRSVNTSFPRSELISMIALSISSHGLNLSMVTIPNKEFLRQFLQNEIDSCAEMLKEDVNDYYTPDILNQDIDIARQILNLCTSTDMVLTEPQRMWLAKE